MKRFLCVPLLLLLAVQTFACPTSWWHEIDLSTRTINIDTSMAVIYPDELDLEIVCYKKDLTKKHWWQFWKREE